jgi:hypothetical protein
VLLSAFVLGFGKSIIGSNNEDTIKSMLEELRTFNLVITVDQSNYRSKMVEGQGKRSNISEAKDSDNSLYYLLNWSSPESRVVLTDYKNRTARKEILNISKRALKYSAREISLYNIDIEKARDSSGCYSYLIELAKSYLENGRSPLLALVDLKYAGTFHTKASYIDAWKAMEEAELIQFEGHSIN